MHCPLPLIPLGGGKQWVDHNINIVIISVIIVKVYWDTYSDAPVCVLFVLAVLFGLGDVIAQFVVKKEGEKFNFPRLGRALVFGTFILGPLGHLHYNFIEWLTVHKV